MLFRLIKWALLLGAATLGAGFASINPDQVTLHYYFGQLHLPLGMLALAFLALGILFGVLFSSIRLLRSSHENVRLRRKAEGASQAVPP